MVVRLSLGLIIVVAMLFIDSRVLVEVLAGLDLYGPPVHSYLFFPLSL